MKPIPHSMITSEHNFRNRRHFIASGIAAAIALPLAGSLLASVFAAPRFVVLHSY